MKNKKQQSKGWRRVKLEDVCSKINYGYTASASYEKVGPKFLRITDIVPELIDWDSVPYCNIQEKDYKKYKLEIGDVVIARTGATTGYAKLINKEVCSIFASYLVRFRFQKNVEYNFIGKLIESNIYKEYIKKSLSGSAQPQANAKILGAFEFLLPPLPIQQKIASVLSAYDELIENNTKRIKVLEELAQAVYNEWFVKFRFPGHKKVKMIDSGTEFGKIPEGWEVKKVGEMVKRISSGRKYNNKTVKKTGTVPVLDQGRSGIIGYHDDEPGVVASEENPVIVFANHTCY